VFWVWRLVAVTALAVSTGCGVDERLGAEADASAGGSTGVDGGAGASGSGDGGVGGSAGTSGSAGASGSAGSISVWCDTRNRALAWLGTAPTEYGVDALVMLDATGELLNDPGFHQVVVARTPEVKPSEIAIFGVLLDHPKPPFPPASLDGVAASSTVPDPEMPAPTTADGGNLIEACLEEALGCNPSADCLAFVGEEDRWGYVLTHQSVWLLLTRWMGCSVPIDVDARRLVFGANLVKETAADPSFRDLYAERLAMLGHIGFGAAIEPAWVDTLLAAQEPEGCWRVAPTNACSPHPTSLALLALAHARIAGVGAVAEGPSTCSNGASP
jgi:hypothetical protein